MSDARSASPREDLVRALEAPVAQLSRPPGTLLDRAGLARRQRREARLAEAGLRETSGRVIEPDHFLPDNVHYEPSPWDCLKWAIRPRDIQPGDVFVDLGCGLGRVVCQAAAMPFSRVEGVEISPRLAATAQRIVEGRRESVVAGDVRIVVANAADYAIPDDATYVYLYHPFAGETFRRVIGNVVASLDRRPRPLRLVYVCPAMDDVIAATGRFAVERRRRGGLMDRDVFSRITVWRSSA